MEWCRPSRSPGEASRRMSVKTKVTILTPIQQQVSAIYRFVAELHLGKVCKGRCSLRHENIYVRHKIRADAFAFTHYSFFFRASRKKAHHVRILGAKTNNDHGHTRIVCS